jgi:hypothetical protein
MKQDIINIEKKPIYYQNISINGLKPVAYYCEVYDGDVLYYIEEHDGTCSN